MFCCNLDQTRDVTLNHGKNLAKEVGFHLDLDESRLQLIKNWRVGERGSETDRLLPIILVHYDSTVTQLHILQYAVSPCGRNGHLLPQFHLVLEEYYNSSQQQRSRHYLSGHSSWCVCTLQSMYTAWNNSSHCRPKGLTPPSTEKFFGLA